MCNALVRNSGVWVCIPSAKEKKNAFPMKEIMHSQCKKFKKFAFPMQKIKKICIPNTKVKKNCIANAKNKRFGLPMLKLKNNLHCQCKEF